MIGCIIQSRMSSRRLPGKIMKIVDSKPILYHVINQVSSSKILEKIVVATSTNTDDDMIENFTKKLGISCFRGKLNDVLGRHYQCAKKLLHNLLQVNMIMLQILFIRCNIILEQR